MKTPHTKAAPERAALNPSDEGKILYGYPIYLRRSQLRQRKVSPNAQNHGSASRNLVNALGVLLLFFVFVAIAVFALHPGLGRDSLDLWRGW